MSPHTKAAMNKQQGEHSPFNKYRRQLDAQDQEANARLAEMETKLKEMQEKLMVVTFTFSFIFSVSTCTSQQSSFGVY